jgi:hypothetical protein
MLAADPCSLLDPVDPAEAERFIELSTDLDAGGHRSPKTECEARLALTLEKRGILDGPLTRPRGGEALDVYGTVWDFKGPCSREGIAHNAAVDAARRGDPPPTHVGYGGEYDLQTEVLRVISYHRRGVGIVVDLRRLTYDQAIELRDALLAEPQVNPALLRLFPPDLERCGPDDG